ncbi:nucleoside kinase [Chakrabartyella piscis]|uniref:nucleoside kinase n=1 Tax=Chakrabartyella piscis TaxID=2918914 RepID=UPI002958D757|nr:nucleoside kinase [Chakrabartyella piscis]
MENLQINVMGKQVSVPFGTTFGTLAKDYTDHCIGGILLAKQDNRLQELSSPIEGDSPIVFLDATDEDGMRVYHGSVSLLLVKAVYDLLGKEHGVCIEHSLRGDLYCEIKDMEITEDILAQLEKRMGELVAKKATINKHVVSKGRAVAIMMEQNMIDKKELLRFRQSANTNLYELEGVYDNFYGYMPEDVGSLGAFALVPYEKGFLLRLPDRSNPNVVPAIEKAEKIGKVYLEQMEWCRLMGVSNVAELNQVIVDGKFGDLIRVNEALHEKRVVQIAEEIYGKKDKLKVVLIAGPTSSGKTSFANRLCIQLQSMGMKPHKLSMDDYFVNRVDTPLDEFGNRNYECIETVDIPLLNADLKSLIEGELVEMPHFNFISGEREYHGDTMQLQEKDILVMEGIHGLNERLTELIAPEYKFKIFISAITQLNIDDHNRISTTDSRMLRRMVRDARTRSANASVTIGTWDLVTKGEEENIFPFQEDADAIFNSATLYEISVLKTYVVPLLYAVEKTTPEYVTAKRMLKFLAYFLAAPDQDIPNNSLIKEFTGGSCFKV